MREDSQFDASTEVKAIRQLLRERRGSFRHLAERLEKIPAAVLVADDAGRYIAANHQACALTGYTLEELRARSVADLTRPEDLESSTRLWQAFERMHRQNGRYTLLTKGGATVDVDYDAFWDVAPGIHLSFLKPRSA